MARSHSSSTLKVNTTVVTTFTYDDGGVDLTLERDGKVLLRAELRAYGVDALDVQVSRHLTTHLAYARTHLGTIKEGRLTP